MSFLRRLLGHEHPLLPWSTLPTVRAESCGDGIARFAPVAVLAPSACLRPDLTLTWAPLSVPGRVRPGFSTDGTRHRAWVRVDPCDDLYGGGEVIGPLRRNGRTIALWNTDNFAYARDAGRRLYQAHPWILGVRRDGTAYGVLFDSSWKAELSCNGGITFTTEGPAFAVWTIEGGDPLAVLGRLARLIGSMPMPPRWALGYHQCRWSYHPESEVRRIAQEFRTRRIPCDVLWLDIDYMEGFRVFTVDRGAFPDPAGLNAALAEQGFHSVWMIDPGVKVDPAYRIYADGRAAGHFLIRADGTEQHGKVWPGACAFPDFTCPTVRAWWAEITRDFVQRTVPGLGGIWNDMNEPAVFDGPDQTLPEDLPHRGGGDLPPGPHRQYHNRYGDLMVQATRAGLAAAHPDRRPFVLTRAGFIGSHRHAATWTGDNVASDDHLRLAVPMSLTLGLSGQPFNGPDIGGFAHDAQPILFARWFGTGALFPFCRGHGSKEFNRKEPWAFGLTVEATVRRALERRYRLLPYLYTLAWQAHRRGLPIMRPVFTADPGDPALRAESAAFLLGRDLLVVPRWAERPALPRGDWATVPLVAGETTDADQPELRLRAGAVLPVGPVIQHAGEAGRGPLTLFVHLDADGEAVGQLYDDAGDGPADGSGAYRLTTYWAHRAADGRVTVEPVAVEGDWIPPARDVVVCEVRNG